MVNSWIAPAIKSCSRLNFQVLLSLIYTLSSPKIAFHLCFPSWFFLSSLPGSLPLFCITSTLPTLISQPQCDYFFLHIVPNATNNLATSSLLSYGNKIGNFTRHMVIFHNYVQYQLAKRTLNFIPMTYKWNFALHASFTARVLIIDFHTSGLNGKNDKSCKKVSNNEYLFCQII